MSPPLPPAPPIADSLILFRQYFGSKLCIGATIRPNFFRFSLFCIAFGSVLFVILFFSSLLFLFFLFFSSYPSLLISSYSSRRCYSSSSYSSFFNPFWGQIDVSVQPYVLTIFVLFFFINVMSPAPPIAATLILTALY